MGVYIEKRISRIFTVSRHTHTETDPQKRSGYRHGILARNLTNPFALAVCRYAPGVGGSAGGEEERRAEEAGVEERIKELKLMIAGVLPIHTTCMQRTTMSNGRRGVEGR